MFNKKNLLRRKSVSSEAEPPVTLTINYLYSDNTTAYPSYVNEYNVGDSYNILLQTTPEGYRSNISSSSVSGTITEDTIINVVYTQIYTLTIRYWNVSTNTLIAPTYTGEYAFNETYSVTSPVIEGYTVDKPIVSNSMPARGVVMDVHYMPNEPLIDIDDDTPIGGDLNPGEIIE